MRLIHLLLIALLTVPAAAATNRRPPDCSQRFASLWLQDRDQAMAHMPEKACLLHGEHDQYVCSKDGCVAKS